MATNRIGYRRFSGNLANISEVGFTTEEVKLQHGKPDPNPLLSPMATPQVSAVRLGLAPTGSDKLRLGRPDEPEQNPYEGPQSWLKLNRSAVRKMRGNIVGELRQLASGPEMEASLSRLLGMAEHISTTVTLGERIQAMQAGANKA
ncbi:MAG: hypothetical protein AAB426_07700 [Myxococcota bacterium]